MSDTALPARSTRPVLEEGIHLLHGIVDLLQVHDSRGGFGEGFVDQDDIRLRGFLEFLLGIFGFWFLGRRRPHNPLWLGVLFWACLTSCLRSTLCRSFNRLHNGTISLGRRRSSRAFDVQLELLALLFLVRLVLLDTAFGTSLQQKIGQRREFFALLLVLFG